MFVRPYVRSLAQRLLVLESCNLAWIHTIIHIEKVVKQVVFKLLLSSVTLNFIYFDVQNASDL